MRAQDEEEDFLVQGTEHENSLRLLAKEARDTLFHCFYLCCPDIAEEHRSQHLARYTAMACMHILHSLQLLSLLYPVSSAGWSSYSLWTSLVTLLRFDAAAVRFGLQAQFTYFVAACAFVPICLFVLMAKKLRVKAKIGKSWTLLAFSISVEIAGGVAFIPATCALLAALKYTSPTPMSEYESEVSASLLHPAVHYLCALPLVVFIAVAFLSRTLIYDIFLSNASEHTTARAHSKVESLCVGIDFLAALSHFTLHRISDTLHEFVYAVGLFTAVYHYSYYQPYYRTGMNWAGAVVYGVAGWGAVALLVGEWVDSAACGFLLTVLVPLASAPIAWDVIRKRIAYIRRNYCTCFETLRNPFLGELYIRFRTLQYLDSHSPTANIDLHTFYTQRLAWLFNHHTAAFQTHCFPALWEFAYLYCIVQDINVARVKLTKSIAGGLDIEGAFNQYRFQQLLTESPQSVSEESSYVSFRLQFDSAKQADALSCRLQLRFWTELSAPIPQPQVAESLAVQVSQSLRRAKSQLSKLVQNYPRNHLALRLAGTYFSDVLNDTEHGRELMNRSLYEESEFVGKNAVSGKRFSYFDEGNGILLVAGRGSEAGAVVYANRRAGEILGFDEKMILGVNVSRFIPPSLCTAKRHNAAISHFLSYCTADIIPLPALFFMLDFADYLTPVWIQVKPTSLDLQPYFLVAVNPEVPTGHSMCLIDERGVVQAHTRQFPVTVGYADEAVNLRGISAAAVLQDYHELIEGRMDGDVFSYTLQGTVNDIKMRFMGMRMGSVSFRVLFATADSEEVQYWLGMTATPSSPQEPTADAQPLMYRRRTIRPILKRRKEPKKGKSVQFDLCPKVKLLPETDFPAGNSSYHAQKDAGPISVSKALISAEPRPDTEPEKPSDSAICDIKDLEDLARRGSVKMDAQSQAAFFNELGEKPSARSVASSTVSSNASFTNSKLALDLLTVVNISMKRFKVSFLLTNLAVIVFVVAMLVYLVVAVKEDQTHLVVPRLCERAVLASALAFDARSLMLVAEKRIRSDSDEAVRLQLNSDLQRFDSVLDFIASFAEDLEPGAYRDLYVREEILLWELTANSVSHSFSNLLNIMRQTSLHAHRLLSTPSPSLSSSDPSLFFLFRNGEGESLRTMNESTLLFISQQREKLRTVLVNITVMGGMALLLLVACFAGVIVPVVLAVDRSNEAIWQFFYKLPSDIVQDIRFRCEERLESTHSLISAKAPAKVERTSTTDIRCSRKWPYIYRRLWVYYVLSVGFGVYFYFAVYLGLADMMIRTPDVVRLLGDRTLTVQSSRLWLREVSLGMKDAGHEPIWQTSTYWPDPHLRLATLLDHLRTLESLLFAYEVMDASTNDAMQKTVFDDFCGGFGMTEECVNSFNARGVHSAILSSSIDYSYIFSLNSSSSISSLPLSPLLANITQTLMQQSQDELDLRIAAKKAEIVLVTSLYCVFCLLFYFAVYLPITARVKTQLTDIWDLASLIPMELNERITRAMKRMNSSQANLSV